MMWAAKSPLGDQNNSIMEKTSIYPSMGTRSIVSKHTHQKSTTNLAYRNYVKDVETLRKELDRKDARNDAIAQEMKRVRSEFTNQERELRILSGAFEKCNNERLTYQNEVSRNKEYIDKLELQLSKLGEGATLIQTVDKLQLTNEHYASELSNLKGVVAFKDEKIHELERELGIFHKSVELQREIEGRNSNTVGGSNGGNDTTMRTLYYELGKRQTDAHSLALTLASTNQQLKNAHEDLAKIKADDEEMRKEMVALKSNGALLNQQAVKDKDEISDLLDKNQKFKSLNQRLQGVIEDLSKRLREERESFLSYKTEKENNEQELTHTLDNANKELHHIRSRMRNLEDSFKLCEKRREEAEQALSKEHQKMDDERKVYANKIKEGMNAIEKNKVLNMQLKDSAKKQEGASAWAPGSPVHDFARQKEHELKSLQEELNKARETEAELLGDREASVRALHQTIEATRELSARHAAEKSMRSELEKKLADTEAKLKRAEQRILALMEVTPSTTSAIHVDRNPKTNADQRVVPSNTHSASGGMKEVNFVDEGEIFSSAVPPQHGLGAGPGASSNPLGDSIASAQSDTSTASSVAEELARLRAELHQIEQNKPQ